MCLTLVPRQRPAIGRRLRHLERRFQAEQLGSLVDAVENELQEPGLAILVFHGSPGLLRIRSLPIHGRGLQGLAGTLPSVPGVLLDERKPLQFLFSSGVEISDGGFPPGAFDLREVAGHTGLAHAQLFSDGPLRQALQVQLGHFLAALDDLKFVVGGHAQETFKIRTAAKGKTC